MLALRKVDGCKGGIELQDVEEPHGVPDGEVLLRVEAAGICGTDLHIYNWGKFARERMALPVTLGHEIAGVIESTGRGVVGLQVGDRVCVESHIPCGVCAVCRRGDSHVCAFTRYPGVDFDGGFARYVALPASAIQKVPEELPVEAAALLEPFGIAVHACGEGLTGKNVVVVGCGPIGLMAIAVARAYGANRILAADRHGSRVEAAEKLGADRAITVGSVDLSSEVRGLFGCEADVLLEVSGSATAVSAAADLVAPGGEIRLVGVPEGEVAVEMEKWLFKGLTIKNIHGRKLFATWERALRLVANNEIDLTLFVSEVVSLTDAPKAFESLLAGKGLKVVVRP